MHVGLISGIGPAATDFYYRGLIERHVAAGIPLELTMAHSDVREMSRNRTEGNAKKQAEIFARLIDRMRTAGAKAAAVTSMGGHFCINELLTISPLPLVHGIHAVDAAIKRSGLKRIGVLGTREVMETGLYGGVSSAQLFAPDRETRIEVSDAYFAMASVGRVTDQQREVFLREARRLVIEKGVEAIMLGGTDMFLAFQGQTAEFRLVDCADIHVDAIFQKSSGENAA
jgi:aspartate racemase